MQTLVPYIDETIPLPANAAEALPDLTPVEELNMRVRTIKLISDLTGQPIIPLKNYVINKLVVEIETTKDPKLRIQSVTKLGEIDGVDAFKKRSEITHQVKPIEEVEKELMQVLEGIEYSVVDSETPEINPDDYLLPDQNGATNG